MLRKYNPVALWLSAALVLAANAAAVAVTEVIVVGGEDGAAWESGGGDIPATLILSAKSVEHTNAPGGVVDFDPLDRPNWIFPQQADTSDNILIGFDSAARGGNVFTPIPSFRHLESGFSNLHDNDGDTALEVTAESSGSSAGAFGLIFQFDLGAIFGVNRIRFFPRNAAEDFPSRLFPNQREFLKGFEIFVNDGSPESIRDESLIWETIALVGQNEDAVVDIRIPTRIVRHIRLKSLTQTSFEIAEFQVFTEGFVPQARYVSNIFDFGQQAILGNLRYIVEQQGDPQRSDVQIRTRAGIDPNPVEFTRIGLQPSGRVIKRVDRANLEAGSDRRAVEAGGGSGRRRAIRPDQQCPRRPGRRRPRIAAALQQPVPRGSREKITLDEDSYFDLDKEERSIIRDDLTNWSPWSPPYPLTAVVGDTALGESTAGTAIFASGPRRYFQFMAEFSSETFDAGSGVGALAFDVSRPAFADSLIAEIFPRASTSGAETDFTYAVLYTSKGADIGFDRLQITTPIKTREIGLVQFIATDGSVQSEADFTGVSLDQLPISRGDVTVTEVTDEDFTLSFPRVETSGTLLKVAFKNTVLRVGTRFAGLALNSDDLTFGQPVEAGNAADLSLPELQDPDTEAIGTTNHEQPVRRRTGDRRAVDKRLGGLGDFHAERRRHQRHRADRVRRHQYRPPHRGHSHDIRSFREKGEIVHPVPGQRSLRPGMGRAQRSRHHRAAGHLPVPRRARRGNRLREETGGNQCRVLARRQTGAHTPNPAASQTGLAKYREGSVLHSHRKGRGGELYRSLLAACLVQFALSATAFAQDYGSRLGVQRGGSVSFEPTGPGVIFGALDPTVRRWYVPQELYNEYRWRQWEYSNYARQPYQRYVSTNLEGDYFYDLFGDFVSRGWLVYDWRQDQPVKEGSSIFKGSNFNGFFSSLTVSSDSQGQYAYAITVGNRIRSTLTPMTFSKPNFNGVQIDFAADKYSATVLASRISDPTEGTTLTPRQWTNSTSLVGGRATIQVGDFITVGGTLVDARNANTSLDMFSGNFIAGNLTSGQSSTPVSAIAIVLSDDSPEDGEGGAALFSHNIRVRTKDFESGLEQVLTLEQVVRPGAEWPAIFGGFQREGFLAADGNERVILNYDFTDPAYIGPDLTSIIDVEFEYLVANDYKIQMWSNRQTGRRDTPPSPLTSAVIDESEPVLLTIKRAGGNIKDISNVRVVKFNYGLPTANLIGGFTIEGKDVLGWDFYGEWDRNKRYSQYPNAALFAADEGHEISSETAEATLFTISKQEYPYFAFGEFYSIDGDYSTSAFVTDTDGELRYDFPLRHVYEFVEDNDDQDSRPDWGRVGNQSVDRQVFPGWDENNDFISDFNQNDNASVPNIVPDYDEPFLRHHVDRPEFLFGIDLNNNGWIDRFEDDELPDYP